jgi:hypothetical protein
MANFSFRDFSPLSLRSVQQSLNWRLQTPWAASSEETTASALNPAPAAVPGLDDRQVFEGFLAPELPATITCRNAIDRGLDLAAYPFEGMATVKSARFDAVAQDVAEARELLDIDCRLARLRSKQSALAQQICMPVPSRLSRFPARC